MHKNHLIILFLLLAVFCCHRWNVTHLSFSPGVAAPVDPQQSANSSMDPFEFSGFTISPLAIFEVTALVLSSHHYFFGQEASLAPVDLALGWGPMSDGTILKDISISQGMRWYFFYYQKSLIDQNVIVSHSGNMHLIPSSKDIEKAVKKAKKGDVVSFKGFLVNINRSDGWRWNSSLSRTDTGAGSCEIVWVKEFRIMGR